MIWSDIINGIPQLLVTLLNAGANLLAQIVQILVTAVVVLMSWLLAPLFLLIGQFIPNLNDGIVAIHQWIQLVQTYFGWVIDALLIPQYVLNLGAAWIVFRLSWSLFWWFIETAVFRWLVILAARKLF